MHCVGIDSDGDLCVTLYFMQITMSIDIYYNHRLSKLWVA